MDSASDF